MYTMFLFFPFLQANESAHVSQRSTSLNLLCNALLLTAYTVTENQTKQLIVTIPINIAMVYYQHLEIADSS